MSGRVLPRGKRGAERRLNEQFARDVARRQAEAEANAVDFDIAEVDAEAADARQRQHHDGQPITLARAPDRQTRHGVVADLAHLSRLRHEIALRNGHLQRVFPGRPHHRSELFERLPITRP